MTRNFSTADKGKGRQMDFSPPPVSPHPIDYSRVLVPDSSDTPQKDMPYQVLDLNEEERLIDDDTHRDLDGFSDDDFERYGRLQDEAEEDGMGLMGGPPSPGMSPIGASPRFFDVHSLASQGSPKVSLSSSTRFFFMVPGIQFV